MNKQCLVIISLLLLVLAGGIYKFIFQGSVSSGSDGRVAINLDEGERDLVLAEMRAFLESIQKITQAITEKNMEQVAINGRLVGKAAQAAVPGTLIGKLPVQFKKLGSDTHVRFDQIAMDAEEFGDTDHALQQLSELMQNCVSCHAKYRFNNVSN